MSDGRTRPVLVGVDGSPESVAAARWGAAEAALRRRPLEIACVYYWPAPLTPLSVHPPELTGESLREDAERVVAGVIEQIPDAGSDVQITARAIAGLPAYKLIELSADAGMVVVGHRGHGGFAGLRLGSVAVNVAAHASCPVAVIRATAADAPAARDVLVGVDGSGASDPVLSFAFDEAARREARLTALTAYERSNWPGGLDADAWRTSATQRLRALLQPWHEKYPEVPVETLVSPEHPAAALIEAARQADLLVVGSRGHGGFVGLLLGSVSQQAINYAPGPVVVVR
jgi:nucleotide-binding universal stress UspA family protein